MQIKERKQEEVITLGLDGKLDVLTSHQLEERAFQLMDEGNSKFIVDFSGVDYISSSGLRVVLAMAQRLEKIKGRILLCGLVPDVKDVFDISGFTALFEIFDTQDEAFKSIQS